MRMSRSVRTSLRKRVVSYRRPIEVLQRVVRIFRGDDRDKYRRLSTELSDLNVRFSQNVTNDMASPERRLWVKEEDTAGLPESIKKAAREVAKRGIGGGR